MTTLVEQAIKTLSVICNTTALHPSDEDRIKNYLKALHKHGENISPSIIESLINQENWQSNPSKLILKWAEAISTGGRVVIKDKMFIQPEKEVIAHLENQIKNS